MNDTDNSTDVDEAWAVEPPKPVLHGREALRRALRIMLVAVVVVVAMAFAYDLWCLYCYNGHYVVGTYSGVDGGGYVYFVPKPRKFAPGVVVRKYNSTCASLPRKRVPKREGISEEDDISRAGDSISE